MLRWRDDIEAALADLLPRFEATCGYPAGENVVRQPASPPDLAAAAANPLLPRALVDLYSVAGASACGLA
jgi:hypothetical protein